MKKDSKAEKDERICDVANGLVDEAMKGGEGFSEEMCDRAISYSEEWERIERAEGVKGRANYRARYKLNNRAISKVAKELKRGRDDQV